MARSLSRSTQLYISAEAGGISSPTAQNLFEVKVLDGYSFSQDTSNTEIGVNEAGESPVRGTLAFNTALNPVDVSFSTYVRAYQNSVEVDGSDTGATGKWSDCVERVLWCSAMGSTATFTTVSGSGAAATEVIEDQDGDTIQFGLDKSNNNELLDLTLYFVLENTTYVVDDFNVGTGEVDFSIDGIATINWSGQGSLVTEDRNFNAAFFNPGLTAGTDYTSVPATTAETFLRNKLSALTLKQNVTDANPSYASGDATYLSAADNVISFVDTMTLTSVTQPALVAAGDTLIGGRIYNAGADEWRTITALTTDETLEVDNNLAGETVQAATSTWSGECVIYSKLQDAPVVYDIPITGATVTLENNFTYLTPEELAIVNKPLAGFAGNRVVSGSLTAYLNSGAEGSGGLLADMLGKIEGAVTNNYQLIFKMGGTSGKRVEFTLPTCQLGVPSTAVEDIISTEISFTSKPTTGSAGSEVGSFEATNELTINYYDGVA